MNRQKFKETCDAIINFEREKNGIGTLGEKTLHAVLKHYYEPMKDKQEIVIDTFVADIVNEKGIIEIQTRAFNKLRKKLEHFLKINTVTLVYPIPKTKWLLWIDQQTGEITKRRKSPRKGDIYDIFFELYKIKQLLDSPNLRLCIVLLEVEEYRYLNGWSKDKKRSSTRMDRIPVDIIDEIQINGVKDYINFLPKNLKKQFTSKDYKSVTHLSLSNAQLALNILNYLKVVKRVGKVGNSFLYECETL